MILTSMIEISSLSSSAITIISVNQGLPKWLRLVWKLSGHCESQGSRHLTWKWSLHERGTPSCHPSFPTSCLGIREPGYRLPLWTPPPSKSIRRGSLLLCGFWFSLETPTMFSVSGAGTSTFVGALPCHWHSVCGVITLLSLNPQPCVFSAHPPHPKFHLDYTGSKLKPLAQVHTASEWLSVQMKVIEIQAS